MDRKIIVVGYVGLEGSLEMAKENAEELKSHFSKYFMKQVEECEKYLVSSKAFHEMGLERSDVIVPLGENRDVTSLWSALWHLCEAWGMGIEVEFSQIPIRQETIEICQFVGRNPYQISSKGTYVILTSQAEDMIEGLRLKEIPAHVIGKTTHKRERLIKRREYVRHLPRPN